MDRSYAGLFCLGMAALLLLWKFFRRKYVSVHKYEYLEIMSYKDWKAGLLIRREMQVKKSGLIDSGIFYVNMMELEDEGLIERRIITGEYFNVKIHEFRKTGVSRIKEEENSLARLPVLQHA
jgi:hypothetical protein